MFSIDNVNLLCYNKIVEVEMLQRRNKHPRTHVIRISNELVKELEKQAEPLADNVESVLWKILGKPEEA